MLARLRRTPAPEHAWRLPPRLVKTLVRLAPAVINPLEAPASWTTVAAQAERWLALLPEHARARVLRLLWLVEWAPLARGMPPVSSMTPEQAHRYVAGPLAATRGFWATLGRVRQLLRLAWYGDPARHAALGFQVPRASTSGTSAAPLVRVADLAPTA